MRPTYNSRPTRNQRQETDGKPAIFYPTETICKVVREHKMLSLKDVHWRQSTLPAEVAGFRGRGQLRKGAPADIVIYDFDGLRVLPDEIVHDLPGGEWRMATSTSWSTGKSQCAMVSRPIRIPAACCGTEVAEQAVLSKLSDFLNAVPCSKAHPAKEPVSVRKLAGGCLPRCSQSERLPVDHLTALIRCS